MWEIDELEEGETVIQHLIAGAIAGVAEHCAMFPIDTIKTNMQAFEGKIGHIGLYTITQNIIQRHGLLGLFRGITAMAVGAAPSHAAHFATYEFCKVKLGGKQIKGHHPFISAVGGICATIVSDAILTPMDTIKQRMQLTNYIYKGMIDCIRTSISERGIKALYAGYSTTLLMNIPYNAIYFAGYESFRLLLKRGNETEFDISAHFIAGAGAGTLAASFTNPLDVAKTRLQTQSLQVLQLKYWGVFPTLKIIWKEEGFQGFIKGIKPRIILHSTSAAISWTTYEFMKYWLTKIGI